MADGKRQNHRESVKFKIVVHWDEMGQPCSGEFRARDLSDGGMQIVGTKRIETGEQVRIDVPRGFQLEAVVRYCAPAGDGLSIGLAFSPESQRSMRASKKMILRHNHHCLLGQISSGICEHATRLQRLDLERLRRWAALGEFREIVADLKGRIAQRTVVDAGQWV